jgi:hypothetical protein
MIVQVDGVPAEPFNDSDIKRARCMSSRYYSLLAQERRSELSPGRPSDRHR